MSSRTFDRETLLDLIVNAIPLAMMAFFVGVFVLYNPFGTDIANQAIQLSIVVITFGALVVLTYFSARAISNAEAELKANPEEFAEPQAAAADPSELTSSDEPHGEPAATDRGERADGDATETNETDAEPMDEEPTDAE